MLKPLFSILAGLNLLSGIATAAADIKTVNVGTSPSALTVGTHNSTPKVYVANSGSNNVTVLDAFGNVLKTVSVGKQPSNILAWGERVYAINNYGNSISVLETSTDSVTATLPTGNGPFAVIGNTKAGNVYVANSGHSSVMDKNFSITVIGSDAQVAGTIPVPFRPTCLAVDTSANRLYVGVRDEKNRNSQLGILVIDGSTLAFLDTIYLDAPPSAIAINPRTGYLYTVSSTRSPSYRNPSGTNWWPIRIFDTRNDYNELNAAMGGQMTVSILVNPDANLVYVSNFGDGTVTVLNGADNSQAAVINTQGQYTRGMAGDAAISRVYAVNEKSGSVAVIDSTSFSWLATVGASPGQITLIPGVAAFVVNYKGNSVTRIQIH
ncbi:MAG: beta-propeller [Fibrobacteria bacterium]|jgi:YVTN family beta-propeller protein|nr:beta-propeller [Fibrobacteria bacterium]